MLLSLVSSFALAAGALAPERLWAEWPERRFVKTVAPCVRPAELVQTVGALRAKHPKLRVEEVGRSVQGRPIQMLTIGSGPRRTLLWSQMHGDEPSATPALLDLAHHLLENASDPDVSRLLSETTLLMIPMLNPDGAERYVRRNAQGIDINRDALNLATPEGRTLKAVRDRFNPELGFNLHDQGRRTTVGNTGKLATISLLAVAGDAQGTLTPGRARAKRVASAIVATLTPYVAGGIARYDEDWSPRAFGDNITAWGTPVVLIESGGFASPLEQADLTRLNFVALGAVLSEWASDDLRARDALLYDRLLRNDTGGFSDVALRGGRVAPAGREPFRADVTFDVLSSDRARLGCAVDERGRTRITEVGDARFVTSRDSFDASGLLITAGFVASAEELPTEKTLAALQALGVTRVLWHVEAARRDAALRQSASLGALSSLVRVVGADQPRAWLKLRGAPSSPSDLSLVSIVRAVSGDEAAAREAEMKDGLLAAFLGPPENAASIAVDGSADLVLVSLERARVERVLANGRVLFPSR